MASIIAGVGTGLLVSLATALFNPGNKTNFDVRTNILINTISEVIYRNMQDIHQATNITQNIIIGEGFDATLCRNTIITNNTVSKMRSVGTFDAKAVANIQNTIMNMIQQELVNDANVRAAWLSALPPNTTNVNVENNFRSVVQNVYSVTNMNTIKQSLIINQNLIIGANSKVAGDLCTLENTVSMQLMATASLAALSTASFENTVTNSIMTSIRNQYKAIGEGPLSFLSGLLDGLMILVVGIIIVVVITAIVGIGIKLFRGSGAPETSNLNLLPLLFTSSKAGPSETKAKDTKTVEVKETKTP